MRVAIVGLGVMGRNHERVLRGLGHDVVTVDPAGHADFASALDADWGLVRSVIIATPRDHLVDRRIELGSCGVRCLVEKPGAESPKALRRYLRPGDWIGYTERFNPVVRELQARIGEVRSVHVERLGGPPRHPVSAAVDLATHDLDLLGMLGVDRTPIAVVGDEGHFSALLAGGSLTASHAHPTKRRRIVVTGYPTLEADLIQQRLWVEGVEVPIQRREPLADQDAAFLRGDPCPVSITQAAETLRLAQQLEGMCVTARSDPTTQPTSSPA
jgi:hypothetical protein